jgi:type II secretory pathway pseudopilin PulG
VIVVISLLGMIGATIGSAIINQQRFQRDASELLDARQGVRDAMEVLSGDIRGSTPADTIRLMADSAVELFTSIGTSVACRTASGTAIYLAAESSGNTLTSFLLAPDTGDLVLVFRTTGDPTGGTWERHRVAALSSRSNRPGCFGEGSGPAEGFLLTLRDIPDPGVSAGAPVRFIRRGRYSLYRGSDGSWYLGYRRCNALGPSVCTAIQPLSGPYVRYSADEAETGFLFEYFDAYGVRVDSGDPMSVARIDVTARAERNRTVGATAAPPLPEYAKASIALRNR